MNFFVTFFQLTIILITFSAIETAVTLPSEKCPPYPKLNALPGNGWCSLRNIEMNPIVSVTYNECQILETPTGKYLIPDHFHITPKSTSDVDTFGELIDDYQSFTSITARSIGASASGANFGFHAAGSFSDEYKHMKKTQVENKSVTTRVTGRYVVHSARFDEYAVELHPDLKDKLLDAIEALTVGNVTRASLILELTILTHGTHVITHIDLGGVIAKEDYISHSYRTDNEMDQHKIAVSASIGYYDFFNVRGSYNKQDYSEQYAQYVKSITSTKISTYGGELYKPTSNVSSWVDSLPKYLEPVDRSGVPLPYIISPKHFRNHNQTILAAVRREFSQAIEHFNGVNVRIGCMNQYAPNFDYNANIPDKLCNDPPTNYSLGGIFQTCHCYRQGNPYMCDDKCKNYVVKNYLTEDTSCPASFSPVYLNGQSFEKCWWTCWSRWFTTHCTKECVDYEYKAYWCAANTYPVLKDQGLMFGGVYTSTAYNPITGSKSCPPNFSNVTILTNLTVCTSNAYELGYKYSVPFGGFFSCHQGNPLASITTNKSTTTTLETHTAKFGCATGYSQHPAAIDYDCLISYCVKANSFGSDHKELPILLPPFQNYDVIFAQEALTGEVPVINGMSIAVIVLGTLLGLLIVGIVSFVVFKKWKEYEANFIDNDRSSLIVNNDQRGYQSLPGNDIVE